MISLTPPPKAAADEERVRGWNNVGLSTEGDAIAKQLAKELKGKGIGLLTCSDLPRAVETAEFISKAIGVLISSKSKDLRTWGMGELEGSGLEDSEKIIKHYTLVEPDKSPKGGESFNRFRQRALGKLSQIMDVSIGNGVIIGVVTHHWVLDLALRWVEAGAKPDFSLDKKSLFWAKEDPPATIHDMRLSGKKWSMVKVPPGTIDKYHPGPVIIRHAPTNWN